MRLPAEYSEECFHEFDRAKLARAFADAMREARAEALKEVLMVCDKEIFCTPQFDNVVPALKRLMDKIIRALAAKDGTP